MVKKTLKGIITVVLGLSLCLGLQTNVIQQSAVKATTKGQIKVFKLILNGKLKEYVKITQSKDGHWYVPQNIIKKYSAYNLIVQLSNSTIVAKWKTYDIRNVNFGYTKSQVKQAEKYSNYINEDNKTLWYKVTMGNYDANIMYYFNAQGKLYRAVYQIDKDYLSTDNECINDYENIKTAMVKKYGKSQMGDNDYLWKDDLYKDDSSEWGTAIFAGYLSCFSKWHMWNKDVYLFLNHDDTSGIGMYIFYDSTIVTGDKDTTEQKLQGDI